MTNPNSQVAALWLECSRIIDQRFGLEAPTPPRLVEVIDAQSVKRIGGHYDSSVEKLQIHPDTKNGKIPLAGVVYRECLYHSLPSELCFEAKRDLASEFTRQVLKKSERNDWINAWRTIPAQRFRPNLLYSPYGLMSWINALGGPSELDTLVHEFLTMARYGKSMDFDEYVEYMTLRTRNIVVELSHSEIKILDSLLKEETASYRRVAEISGLSESWVSTQISRLKQKYVLMSFTNTPYSRIGIRTFHVLLAGPSWSEPSEFLTDCPFIYDIRSILNGPWQTLARLTIPDCTENIHSLDKMVSILNGNGIAIDVAETYSVGISNSFYHYSTQKNKWEIPWVAMQGWGHRILEESLDQLVERIDIPAKTTDLYLDSLDMSILTLVQEGISSTRSLRKELSIGQTKLLTRIKNLKNGGLIRTIWNVSNIGLVERVAIRATDRKTAGVLDTWSRELPRAFLRYEENRNLLMLTDLPAGGSSRLMETIRALRWPVSISPLSSGIWGHWQFPESSWDVEKQRWTAPREDIRFWLNNLAEKAETLTIETSGSQRNLSTTRRRT